MALDFPNNPTLNDIYVNGGKTYVWDGVSWNNMSSLGYTGSVGDLGFTGSQGYSGSIGYTGSKGDRGDKYKTSSTSSVSIANGTKTFIVDLDLAYTITQTVKVVFDSSNYMEGSVVSYNPNDGELVLNITSSIGSGSYSLWTINLAGSVSSQGYTGSAGAGFTGSQGSIGFTGSVGFTGSIGSLGYTGSLGPVGYTGSIGSLGYTGSQGTIGYTGSLGPVGYTGSQGVVGYTGSVGFTGSQGTGFTGSKGDVGYTGSVGFTGSTGFTGSIGSIGFTGSKGDTGSTGFTGSQGDIGPVGYTGSGGGGGATVTVSSTPPSSPSHGDLWWNSEEGSLKIYYDDGNTSQWVDAAPAGGVGPIGYAGSQGITGFTGSKGDIGFTGFTGSAGAGYTGSKGDIGSIGPVGYTGSKGDIGSTGFTGSSGTGGATVTVSSTPPSSPSSGDLWWNSDEGALKVYYVDINTSQWIDASPAGGVGSTGYTGSVGSTGYTGSKGDIGSVGYTGSQGLSIGLQTLWIPAISMTPTITNGAGTTTTETTNNKAILKTLDFDTATQEFAQCIVRMPKSWDESTITYQVYWCVNSTPTGNVVWSLGGGAVSNTESLDVSTTTSTVKTTTQQAISINTLYATPVSSPLTIQGTPLPGDLVFLQISRDVANIGDTLNIDARLIGVSLFYNVNAGDDS